MHCVPRFLPTFSGEPVSTLTEGRRTPSHCRPEPCRTGRGNLHVFCWLSLGSPSLLGVLPASPVLSIHSLWQPPCLRLMELSKQPQPLFGTIQRPAPQQGTKPYLPSLSQKPLDKGERVGSPSERSNGEAEPTRGPNSNLPTW